MQHKLYVILEGFYESLQFSYDGMENAIRCHVRCIFSLNNFTVEIYEIFLKLL